MSSLSARRDKNGLWRGGNIGVRGKECEHSDNTKGQPENVQQTNN